MNKLGIALKLFFLIFVSFCYSQNINDSLSYSQKLRSGEFQFPFYLSEDDEIKLPIEYQIELNISELRDVSIKETDFYIAFETYVTTIRDTTEILKSGETIGFGPHDYFRVLYPESDKTYFDFPEYEGKVKYPKAKDSLSEFTSYYEFELPHKWDLRNYPFDTQKLKIIFQTIRDTSIVKIIPSLQFPPNINPNKFKFLLDGLNIKNITTEKEYLNSGSDFGNYVGGKRTSVEERLIFNINIDRTGSFLYFKLFFGGFLSFLISFLVYFIDSKYFETRITLSLGGIFGAVGNKYFVENSMPAIQVFTKADLINNLVVIFIILNIFIVIGQHTKSINLWKFEKNKFAAVFVFIAFIVLNYLSVVL